MKAFLALNTQGKLNRSDWYTYIIFFYNYDIYRIGFFFLEHAAH